MLSSAYYKSKIEILENAKSQLRALLPGFDTCATTLTKSQKYTEEINLSGEPIDQGKLSEVSSSLKNAESDIQTIINECSNKILDYQDLYSQALYQEEQARIAAENRRRAQARAETSPVAMLK
jgi:hypothetical protein